LKIEILRHKQIIRTYPIVRQVVTKLRQVVIFTILFYIHTLG